MLVHTVCCASYHQNNIEIAQGHISLSVYHLLHLFLLDIFLVRFGALLGEFSIIVFWLLHLFFHRIPHVLLGFFSQHRFGLLDPRGVNRQQLKIQHLTRTKPKLEVRSKYNQHRVEKEEEVLLYLLLL
jgi:hypothetical protein